MVLPREPGEVAVDHELPVWVEAGHDRLRVLRREALKRPAGERLGVGKRGLICHTDA